MSGQNRKLEVGASQLDITPKFGVQLAGAVGIRRPAKLIADPLYAKALVLKYEDRKACILALDVTIITERYTKLIRESAKHFGFDPGSIMVHAVQTHSAPSVGHFMFDDDFKSIGKEFDWVRGGDEEYSLFVVQRAVDAIKTANDSLQPVNVGVASGIEGRVAFNRRAVKQDGSVNMPGPRWQDPLGPKWIRYLEGPIDPELGVICFQNESMQMIAIVVHYTCHPVNVFAKEVPIVSADWPGALSDKLRNTYGRNCVPLVLNGACGNINPWNPFDPNYVPDHLSMGATLAETTQKVTETIEFENINCIDYGVKRIQIPIRELTKDEIEFSQKMLKKHPEIMWADSHKTRVDWNWMRAASLESVNLCRQRDRQLSYEIQVIRIGKIAIVGLPGEPFVEGQLRIKISSPTYPTYVAHATTQYVGYLPTKEAFKRGGHEVATSYWSKLIPEALDMAVDGAIELLNEVFTS